MKLACCEALIPGETFADKVANLEQAGYQGIEIGGRTSRARLAEMQEVLEKSNIRVSALLGQLDGALLSSDKLERDRVLNTIKDRLAVAKELSAAGVIMVPVFGRAQIPDLTPYMNAVELEGELLTRLLPSIAEVAEKLEVDVFLEPLNRYETHFLNRLEQAAAFSEELGSPRVKVLGDLFHMSIEEADLEASIRDNAKYLGHMHFADSNRLLPGKGHLSFRSIFEVLRSIGYTGWCSLECSSNDSGVAGLISAREHLVNEGGVFSND